MTRLDAFLSCRLMPVLAVVVVSASSTAFADTFYECVGPDGVVGYYNKKQTGQKCRIYMDLNDKSPTKPAGARCIVQRYRDTVFYKCEKNGVWYIFNKVSGSGGSKSGRDSGGKKAPARETIRKIVSSDEINVPARSGRGAGRVGDLEKIVTDAAAEFQIPRALLLAVIEVESGFNPDVVSPVGAQGLMQLMPVTADYLDVDNPFDPVQNVRAGARLLRILSDRFEGNLELVMAAYYAGSGTVQAAGNAVPASCETYVARVMDRYRRHSADEAR